MLQLILKILYVIGYVFLVGPPRAMQMLESANQEGGELAGQPLWKVAIVEYIIRGGLFLVAAVLIEETVGDVYFEMYKIDFFFAALIIAGGVHALFYLMAFGWQVAGGANRSRLYRFGRNFAYAVVPAFPAAGLALFWQQFNQQELFSGQLVNQVFLATWGVFILAGLIEALLVSRQPMGLDGTLQEKLNDLS